MGESLLGEVFGRWTVIGREARHCLVRCECGATSRALPFDLRNGKTRMCRDCKYRLRSEIGNPKVKVHGLAGSPTQSVWSDMKRRCYNPARRGYERYGGRGVKVCDRWLLGDGELSAFECFVADMGIRPSMDHQIDRIDSNGHYEPANCRWVARSEQDYNKRNTWRFHAFGRLWTAAEAESAHGVPRHLIYHRIHIGGMDPETAMTRPSRQATSRKPM